MHFVPIPNLQSAALQQSFAQCWWIRPFLEGSIFQKTYLNHELGSKLFFLGSLVYKLVNLFVFGKIICKMSKN